MALIGFNASAFTPVSTGNAPSVTSTSANVNSTPAVKNGPSETGSVTNTDNVTASNNVTNSPNAPDQEKIRERAKKLAEDALKAAKTKAESLTFTDYDISFAKNNLEYSIKRKGDYRNVSTSATASGSPKYCKKQCNVYGVDDGKGGYKIEVGAPYLNPHPLSAIINDFMYQAELELKREANNNNPSLL